MNSSIADNIARVQAQILAACQAAGRAHGSVQLLAVSKTWGPDAVRQAHAAGLTAFGENYIQEAVDKITALRDLPLQWHCIGPIQSNKTRLVAEHFDWVHSVDRLKIAQRLSEQRPAHLPPLQVCIQVNVDGGENKSGVSPQELPALAQAVAVLPRLQLRGLMTIPEPAETSAQMRWVHAQARVLFEALRQQGLAVRARRQGKRLGHPGRIAGIHRQGQLTNRSVKAAAFAQHHSLLRQGRHRWRARRLKLRGQSLARHGGRKTHGLGLVAALRGVAAHITQHRTGFDRRKLVLVTQQDQARCGRQGLQQGVHHFQVHHRGFVHDQHVHIERVGRVVSELAGPGPCAQQRVQGAGRANALDQRIQVQRPAHDFFGVFLDVFLGTFPVTFSGVSPCGVSRG